MEMEDSFPAQDPEFPSAGSVMDWQPDTEQVKTMSEDPEQLFLEGESVSSGPDQGSPDLDRASSELAFIIFRRQLLHNRRIMLLKVQQFRNKSKDKEEESGPSELEAIEQELHDLVTREQELLQIQTDSNAGAEVEGNPLSDNIKELMAAYRRVYVLPGNTPEDMTEYTLQATPPAAPNEHRKTAYQGVYVLSPSGSLQDVHLQALSLSEAPEDIVEVEKLNRDPAIVQCPFCEKVVTTETCRKIGVAAWMLCFVFSMLGCMAGCCLIPFCLDNLKDIRQRCPECHSSIYTAEQM